jgi:hypothetical protein
MHHRSQAEDLNLGRSFSSAYTSGGGFLSRQTSASDDMHRLDLNVLPSTENERLPPSTCWTPTIGLKPPLPPLAELFSPQSMFVDDTRSPQSPQTSVAMEMPRVHPSHGHEEMVGSGCTWLGLPHLYGHDRSTSGRGHNGGFLPDSGINSGPAENITSPSILSPNNFAGGCDSGIFHSDDDRVQDKSCSIVVMGTVDSQAKDLARSSATANPDVGRLAEETKTDAGGACTATPSRFLTVPVGDTIHTKDDGDICGSESDCSRLDYEPPESHQCSVTSMTPLLVAHDDDDDEEDEKGDAKDRGMKIESGKTGAEASSGLNSNHGRNGLNFSTLESTVAVQ